MTDQPIVLLNRMIDKAFDDRVSDIHLEFVDEPPYQLHVRVRRDGQLHVAEQHHGQAARALISRIKALANVGSGAVRKAEEGRYRHRRGSGALDPEMNPLDYEEAVKTLPRADLRLVVLPTDLGETLVLRLPSLATTPDIRNLGFSQRNALGVGRLLGFANGLTLFAGPVGAGKTTSMYSALQYLGGPQKAVYSVEDPIERSLENVTQIEVNAEAGNTYGSVLRAIRRADPQILMIGEIRDQETAKAAIEISIAGARVVSSIHANDSVAAVEAMLTMSAAGPLQVMQSLRGVISQRLVRQVHADCGGAGCPVCGDGSQGRLPIHEVLPITPQFATALAQGANRQELITIGRSVGMMSLREDAQRLLQAGATKEEWVQEVLGNE